MTTTDTASTASKAERDLRLSRVRAAMAADGLDDLLAFAPAWRRENVRYFTDAPAAGTATSALVPAAGSPAAGDVTAFSTRAADLHGIRARGWVGDTQALDAHAPVALTERLRAPPPARLGGGGGALRAAPPAAGQRAEGRAADDRDRLRDRADGRHPAGQKRLGDRPDAPGRRRRRGRLAGVRRRARARPARVRDRRRRRGRHQGTRRRGQLHADRLRRG